MDNSVVAERAGGAGGGAKRPAPVKRVTKGMRNDIKSKSKFYILLYSSN